MSKVTSLHDAVSRHVKPGDTLFLSGAQHGEPSAAIHEIVRQGIDHLTLVSVLTESVSLLIGAGVLDKVLTGWLIQDEKRSSGIIRAKRLNKLPAFVEYSHFGISLALTAGHMGLPFLPALTQIGSDIMKYNPNLETVTCPFTGRQVGAVRAVVPDVGIIHVQRCDAEGNAQKWGSLGVDREGINASRTVIVTTERIVDADVIRREPNLTVIPGFRVSAVVEAPFGAYPMHLAGCYREDVWNWRREIATPEAMEGYLQEFVYGLRDWSEYLEKREALKGADHLDGLLVKNVVLSDPVPSGY